MSSMVIILIALLGLLGLSLLLWGLFLCLGLRWVKAENVTLKKVLVATLLVQGSIYFLEIVSRLAFGGSHRQTLLIAVLVLFMSLFLSVFAISKLFAISLNRAVLAWLPTLFSNVAMLILALFVLRPFLVESFVSAANSMAPTLLGEHQTGICPECGKANYCSIPDPHRISPDEPRNMICEGFHVTQSLPQEQTVFEADRFLVSKYLRPKRWDLVTFRYPGDPSINYVKRLIGLPGETIVIQEGAIYVNGKRLTPPEEIQGIEYLDDIPDVSFTMPPLWGSPAAPAVLGEGEYYVLGDFSAQSKDSRLWESGAPGHPVYVVPEENLIGVVTHIYWPPDRWRNFR